MLNTLLRYKMFKNLLSLAPNLAFLKKSLFENKAKIRKLDKLFMGDSPGDVSEVPVT